jgi:hypothetical protein
MDQLQGVAVFGGAISVLTPLRIQVSMIAAMPVAASAWLDGCGDTNSLEKPTGPGGGAGVYPAMPPPTVTAKAVKADSMAAMP